MPRLLRMDIGSRHYSQADCQRHKHSSMPRCGRLDFPSCHKLGGVPIRSNPNGSAVPTGYHIDTTRYSSGRRK